MTTKYEVKKLDDNPDQHNGQPFEIGVLEFISKDQANRRVITETRDKLFEAVYEYINDHNLDVTLEPYSYQQSRTNCYNHSEGKWIDLPDEQQGVEINVIAEVRNRN